MSRGYTGRPNLDIKGPLLVLLLLLLLLLTSTLRAGEQAVDRLDGRETGQIGKLTVRILAAEAARRCRRRRHRRRHKETSISILLLAEQQAEEEKALSNDVTNRDSPKDNDSHRAYMYKVSSALFATSN